MRPGVRPEIEVKDKATLMKNFIWTVSGLCAAVAGFLVWSRNKQAQPVENLAHRLEEAWADHHTRV